MTLGTLALSLAVAVPLSAGTAVAAVAADSPAVGVVQGPGGLCLDVAGAGTADGTPVQLYECNGTAAQAWQPFADGTVRALGKCLDASAYGGFGYLVQLRTCDGDRVQRWISQENQLVNSARNGCITATSASRARYPLLWSG